jgi:signal transduction histidine kinase
MFGRADTPRLKTNLFVFRRQHPVQTLSSQNREQVLGTALEAATAAHDLRNRIGIAGCEVNLLRHRLGPGQAPVSGYLAALERSLEAANIQLEGLLELTRPQVTLRVTAEPPTADLVQLVAQLVAEQRCIDPAHEFSFVSTVPQLIGAWDGCRLANALRRLLSNAVNYSPGGGHVVVTLERKADEAVVCVSDDGIGIPASDLRHACEPFYRARNAERVAAGLGLGLAIARLIVEQYGGALEAESAEGCGTTFTLRLPLANSRAACTTENTRAD